MSSLKQPIFLTRKSLFNLGVALLALTKYRLVGSLCSEPGRSRDMAGILECPVCMECYEAEGLHLPMVLACGHSICHECCPKLLQEDNTGDKRYLCPMKCDQETRIEPRCHFALL